MSNFPLRTVVALGVLSLAGFVAAAMPPARQRPPLDTAGETALQAYAAAAPPKAFAVAAGGAWGWAADQPNPEAAMREALAACQVHTELRCLPLMEGTKWVFDTKAWARSWRLDLSDESARPAPVGAARGQRLPDLAFSTPTGQPGSLSQLRGKVVVLHFWGSWCTPCRQEMPALQKVATQLASRNDIAFVLLQAREPIALSRQWARERGVHLPLHDSGADAQDATFKLKSGARMPDRVLAPVFPSTYVLDQNGRVVFSHKGELTGWPGYAPLLRDLAGGLGR